MSNELTITTFVTPDYVGKLQWTLPTWPSKNQFKNVPIIIFTNGFNEDYSSLEFVKEYYSDWTFVNWNPTNTESMRELVFSSYIFGPHSTNKDGIQFVKTPYFVKIDADSFMMNTKDIFFGDDFDYDLVGHSWSYTKPGWWVPYLENFYNKNEEKVVDKNVLRFDHPRIASFCCLHKTEWVKKVADILIDKLPVPSHDTVLWFYASKMGKWRGKNVKRLGCDNKTKWRSIRESVCTGRCNNNSFLNKEMMSHVQLEITTKCQLKCPNCDRNCGLVPSDDFIPLEKIYKFVEESMILKHEWGRIDIIGGEPTLYPDLEQMWKFIKIYKDKYEKCTIRFSTNGLGEFTKEVLKTLPSWVSTRNSGKTHREQEFVAYNNAPIDNGNLKKDWRCCSVPWRCGIGLTKYGYFPCGAGASVARVFGIDIGIKNLIDVSPESIIEQLPQLCIYCGHSQVKTRHLTKQPEVSDSWKKAIENYNKNEMSLY